MSLLIRGARLIDGTGVEPVEDAAVLVDDGAIASVGPSTQVAAPPAAEVIEAGGLTIMPGLIDAHVHLRTPAGQERLAYEVKTSSELKAFYAADNARRALEAGFTTLRDAGSGPEVLAARQAVDLGLVIGPRILTAGMVTMTAGHADPAMGRPGWPVRPEDTADGVDEVRKRVRQHVRSGHDWIKICTSGGVLSAGDESWWRNYTPDEVRAITDEAHALGRRVASHAHGREGILNAIQCGVDTIEHGIYLDDEILELMVAKRLFLIPTMTIGRAFQERAQEAGLSEEAVRKGNAVMEVVMTNMARAHRAGVRMALGTDCSGSLAPMGENAWELPLMVEIGMTPMEAILAATRDAAEAIGLGQATGTLEPGKQADLILVDGDPLEDISVLRERERIKLVLRQGRILVDRRQGQLQRALG
ncbi:MAG: amidohydrolase family protein [Anaerolineae bacterium]|nr:amidohydrolase family protein [Anaerolineae bacterium]